MPSTSQPMNTSVTTSAKPERSRSPPEGTAEAKRVKAEAEETKKATEARLNQAFEENFSKFEPKLMGNVKDICKGAVIGELKEVNDRLDGQSLRLDAMDLKLNSQQEALTKLQEGMTTLLNGGAGAGSLGHSLSAPDLGAVGPALAPPGPPGPANSQNSNNPFFREINPRVLFFNTHGKEEVTKEEVIKALTPLMLEANIPETAFTVVGDALDSNFEINFPGDFHTARSRASQFKLSLRLSKGKYKTQNVVSPAKLNIQFYINPDKNGVNIRTEILTKGITDALTQAYPDKPFNCSRAGGLVYCNRRALARIIVTGEDTARLSWNMATRVALGIVPAEIDASFASLVTSKGGQWS